MPQKINKYIEKQLKLNGIEHNREITGVWGTIFINVSDSKLPTMKAFYDSKTDKLFLYKYQRLPDIIIPGMSKRILKTEGA
jgi:hypothetical protein